MNVEECNITLFTLDRISQNEIFAVESMDSVDVEIVSTKMVKVKLVTVVEGRGTQRLPFH